MKKALSFILALVLVLGLSVTAFAAELKVSQSYGAITIDGKVDDWSAPAISGTRDTLNWANAGAHSWDVVGGANIVDGQSYDVYLTKDSAYLYVALKINKVETEPTYPEGSSADLLGATNLKDAAIGASVPQFTFAVGAYDAAKYGSNGGYELNTTAGSMGAMVSAWRVGLVDDGGNYEKVNKCVTSWVTAGAIADYTLADEDYAIVYDDANDTYIYEVRVPLSATNITADTGAVALDIDFATPDKAGTGLVRYITGTLSTDIYDGWWTHGWGIQPSHAWTYFQYHVNEAKHIVVETVDTKVGTTASEFSGNIAIDGKVTASEWGEPVIVTTPDHCQTTWGNYWRFDPAAARTGQAAKVYVTNDKENIYIAYTVDKMHLDTSCTDPGSFWNAASFGFSVAKYVEGTTVPHIEYKGEHEQFTGFRIGLLNGTTKAQGVTTHGIDAKNLPEENYAVSYDADTMTYTYEVKLPINMTNINIQETRDIALSIAAPSQNYGSGANLYNITTGFTNAVSHSCPEGVSCIMAHKDNALKITLNDTRKKLESFVLDTAPGISEAVKIDGTITDKEYGGTAVVATNPEHCQATWGNFWQFNPATVNPEQQVKLYVTNDAKYLYVGATIDECDLDETCTNAAELYKAAHFNFSVSGYDEQNTVKHIPFEGNEYEQYTAFMMGFVNGKKASYTSTQGHAAWELPAEDYAITYNPETRTYTYEARVPFSLMNVTTNKIAISASVGAPYTGGDGANRYNMTTGSATAGGAYNWAHKNNAIVLMLTNNPETGDMNVFAVLALATLATAGVAVAVVLKKRASVK